jgi:hypothetical protein
MTGFSHKVDVFCHTIIFFIFIKYIYITCETSENSSSNPAETPFVSLEGENIPKSLQHKLSVAPKTREVDD